MRDLAAHTIRSSEDLGAPAFPCRVTADAQHRGKSIKRPLVKGWQNGAAVSTADAIDQLFAQHPDANYAGLQTGERSRLLVVDLDGEPGLKWWREHADMLPMTRTQRTQREGGRHLYYRIPAGCGLRNSAGGIAPGVDVRADGGFVIDWSIDYPPEVEEVADAPQALIDLVRAASRAKPEAPATAAPGKIPEGKRNAHLATLAGRLQRIGTPAHALEAALQAENTERCDPPLPSDEVAAIARSVGRYAPADAPAEWQPPLVRTYGAAFNPAAIPRRQWVLGNRYSRGEVTGQIGPPGVNKSMLLLTDAVAIATGRTLLRDPVHTTGHVLRLVGEDARRDDEARLAAVCQQYRIEPAELAERLHMLYLSENDAERVMLAVADRDIAMLNASMLDWLRGFPDLAALVIDPMAVWHRLVENDNGAMAMLSAALRGLAAQTGAAVAYDHHVTKASMFDPEAHVRNLAAVRGGGAIGADFRWAFTLARLKPETAAGLGIPEEERRLYRRLDPLKASYADDRDELRLLRVDTVIIANGEPVGVLVEVDTAAQKAAGAAAAEAAVIAHVEAVALAMGRMLRQKRPRSMSETVAWVMQHEPGLFRSAKTGEPLAERTLRGRLLAALGGGLEHEGQRIVCSTEGEGRAARQLVDFEQGGLLP